MYSSSPSGSSMATSSGRSSPEHTSNTHAQQKTQRSNSSFLLPNFLFSPNMTSQAPSSDAASTSTQPPRRTSFGNHPFGAGGGRLSALSAFGFLSTSPNTNSSAVSSSPPSGTATLSTIHQSSSQSSDSTSRPDSASTPQSQSTSKPPPPAKRHVCFPDGMGGTMCLEIKDRNRRGSNFV